MDELEQVKAELAEANQKIEKLTADKTDISKNFDNYREGHKYKNEEYEATVTERDKYKGDFDTLNSSVEKDKSDRREAFIKNKKQELSKWDPKVLSAIEAEYGILNMPEDTEEAISARLEKARSIALAWINPAPSAHDAAGGSQGVGSGSSQEWASEASNALTGVFMNMAWWTPKK